MSKLPTPPPVKSQAKILQLYGHMVESILVEYAGLEKLRVADDRSGHADGTSDDLSNYRDAFNDMMASFLETHESQKKHVQEQALSKLISKNNNLK